MPPTRHTERPTEKEAQECVQPSWLRGSPSSTCEKKNQTQIDHGIVRIKHAKRRSHAYSSVLSAASLWTQSLASEKSTNRIGQIVAFRASTLLALIVKRSIKEHVACVRTIPIYAAIHSRSAGIVTSRTARKQWRNHASASHLLTLVLLSVVRS